MPSPFLLARDHLQQAAAMLQGTDSQSRQLRHIVERTISLIDDMPPPSSGRLTNVLDLETFRARFIDRP